MYHFPKKLQWTKKMISGFILAAFMSSLIVRPTEAQSIPFKAGTVPSIGFQPPVLLGLKVHPENPLLFDFIVDLGQSKLSQGELKSETEKLVKYFLAALTIPDKEVWVNLSPTEKDRIIPDVLGQTVMGKAMLEQDYTLKQLASSLTNPDTELGKKYWEKVGNGRDRSLQDLSKVWIVPSKAEVLESNGIVIVGEKHLKVMMAQEYEKKSLVPGPLSLENANQAPGTNHQEPASEIFRSLILPRIEKEVNEGKNFADVRQIYNSVILAAWYKKALKESLLGKVYADKGKVAGVETDDKQMKQRIYDQYLEAFKKGVYNIIREENDGSGEMIPRKYFSGGNMMGKTGRILATRAVSLSTLENTFRESSGRLREAQGRYGEIGTQEPNLIAKAASAATKYPVERKRFWVKGRSESPKVRSTPGQFTGQLLVKMAGNVDIALRIEGKKVYLQSGTINIRQTSANTEEVTFNYSGTEQELSQDFFGENFIKFGRDRSVPHNVIIIDNTRISGVQFQIRFRATDHKDIYSFEFTDPRSQNGTQIFWDEPQITNIPANEIEAAKPGTILRPQAKIGGNTGKVTTQGKFLEKITVQVAGKPYAWIWAENDEINYQFLNEQGQPNGPAQTRNMGSGADAAQNEYIQFAKTNYDPALFSILVYPDTTDAKKQYHHFKINAAPQSPDIYVSYIQSRRTSSAAIDTVVTGSQSFKIPGYVEGRNPATRRISGQFFGSFYFTDNDGNDYEITIDEDDLIVRKGKLTISKKAFGEEKSFLPYSAGNQEVFPLINFKNQSISLTFGRLASDVILNRVELKSAALSISKQHFNLTLRKTDTPGVIAFDLDGLTATNDSSYHWDSPLIPAIPLSQITQALKIVPLANGTATEILRHATIGNGQEKLNLEEDFSNRVTINISTLTKVQIVVEGGDLLFQQLNARGEVDNSIPQRRFPLAADPSNIQRSEYIFLALDSTHNVSYQTDPDKAIIYIVISRKGDHFHLKAGIRPQSIAEISWVRAVSAPTTDDDDTQADFNPFIRHIGPINIANSGTPEWAKIKAYIDKAKIDPIIAGNDRFMAAIGACEKAMANGIVPLRNNIFGAVLTYEDEDGQTIHHVGFNLPLLKEFEQKTEKDVFYNIFIYGILIKEGAQILDFEENPAYHDQNDQLSSKPKLDDSEVKEYIGRTVEGETIGYRLLMEYFSAQPLQGIHFLNKLIEIFRSDVGQNLKIIISRYFILFAAYIKKGEKSRELQLKAAVLTIVVYPILLSRLGQQLEKIISIENINRIREQKFFTDDSVFNPFDFLIKPEFVGRQVASSATDITPLGGIDFDPSNMNLQIKRDGRGVPLPLPQQNIEQINIQGLTPVIINIVPIDKQNLPLLLGQATKEPAKEPEALAGAS